MTDLSFRVQGVEPLRHAASPHLVFRLETKIEGQAAETIQNILLRTQVRIEPQLRSYDEDARRRLSDLFGSEEQWSRTLHSMLWAQVDTFVPAFSERTSIDLLVPCTYDFNIAATRYFDGVEGGDVPLRLFFSGTIFSATHDGSLRVGLIPWEKEAVFRLPVRVWKDMMELYYPRSAWLRLEKEVFDRLQDFKRRSGLPTWDRAFERLLGALESGSNV